MSIINTAKEIVDLVRKIENVDLLHKVVDLQGEIVELASQKLELEEENKELNKSLCLKAKMVWRKPFYYCDGDNDPYCPHCWESDKAAIHLKEIFRNTHSDRWDCPKCKEMYSVEKGNPPAPQICDLSFENE
jgi:hypothetical protein